MASSASPSAAPDKFKRYRQRYRAQGMKMLRVWVPDPTAPGFAQEAARQAAILKSAPEETDALAFIEQAADRDGWT